MLLRTADNNLISAWYFPRWGSAVCLARCFGPLHKSSFLVAADLSVMGGISSTTLENRSVLSELTLSSLAENSTGFVWIFHAGTFTEHFWTAAIPREENPAWQISATARNQRKSVIVKATAGTCEVWTQPEICLLLSMCTHAELFIGCWVFLYMSFQILVFCLLIQSRRLFFLL